MIFWMEVQILIIAGGFIAFSVIAIRFMKRIEEKEKSGTKA